MLEKPKRAKQLNNQDRQLPATIQELINRYDLENKDIYKFLDYLVDNINNKANTGEGSVAGDTLPIGAVIEWNSDIIPENWLLCNGQAVNREEYSELFEILGVAYGEGDGSTTFNLPNYKGRVAAGKDESDNDFNTLGKQGGEKTHRLTYNEMPKHGHNTQGFNRTHTGISDGGESMSRHRLEGDPVDWGIVLEAGGDQPHNNLQPYIITNFIIKAKQSSGLVATVIDSLKSNSPTDGLSANQGRILNEKSSKHIVTAYLPQQVYSITKRFQLIPLDVFSISGNKLSLENNSIKIGKGASKVLVSAIVFYQDYDTTTAYLYPRINVNGTSVVKAITSRCGDTTRYQSVTFPPFIMNVNEGDLITLSSGEISPSDNGSVRGYDQEELCTYMTVEVVE